MLAKLRLRFSQLMGFAAVLLLIAGLSILVYCWIQAFRWGVVPSEWGVCEGNHGPWRRIPLLRRGVWLAFEMPFYAWPVSALSFCLKPSVWSATILALATGITITVFVTHYWLVD